MIKLDFIFIYEQLLKEKQLTKEKKIGEKLIEKNL
jgi:hypothetical protein